MLCPSGTITCSEAGISHCALRLLRGSRFLRSNERSLGDDMTSIASSPDVVPAQDGFAAYVRGVWDRRDFAWFLATSNLKARNASTTLGIAWWVVNPLLLTGVYFLVFGVVFAGSARGEPEYLAYLMSGMFAFQFTAGVMTGGAGAILGNAGLMKNLNFPRLLLPISSILESGIGFLVSLIVFFAISTPLTGYVPDWSLLLIVPILLAQIVMNLGLGSLTARLAVPFRDVTNLIPFLVRLWLYLSPIIWTLERLDDAPAWVSDAIKLNPMFYFLSVYRSALLGWEFVPAHLAIAAGIAVATALLGVSLFVRFEGRLVQYL
jgi:teichoic acid transport system permease protein